MTETIRFTLNGNPTTLSTDASRKLLWVLRTELEMTGTKYGCGEGLCGATIEGLARDGHLHPLQQAFHEHGGSQCGYCTPGMIMNAYGLLQEHPKPTRAQIEEGMEGNLCRCGAHQRILAAIEAASGQGRRP